MVTAGGHQPERRHQTTGGERFECAVFLGIDAYALWRPAEQDRDDTVAAGLGTANEAVVAVDRDRIARRRPIRYCRRADRLVRARGLNDGKFAHGHDTKRRHRQKVHTT